MTVATCRSRSSETRETGGESFGAAARIRGGRVAGARARKIVLGSDESSRRPGGIAVVERAREQWSPAMHFEMKPLSCDPSRVRGMSERLIISHYENNYG